MNKYVVFEVTAGIVDELQFKLYTKKAAIEAALAILNQHWEEDRYSNPHHPHYTAVLKDAMGAEWERRKEAVRQLHSVDINDDTDLIIREVTTA